MTRIAYFDCFSGASGDMILGALVDAGAELDQIRAGLESLALKGYRISSTQVKRGLIRASRVQVDVGQAKQPHRKLSDIVKLLDDSSLDEAVKSRAKKIFERLAQAEAHVHGTEIEKVHFHEVGAVDSIVDIVGCCIGLELLGIEEIYCSQIATGSGTVKCAHGVLPVPAPATARLLLNVPTKVGYPDMELTTPTGAAVLTALSKQFGLAPDIRTERIGYGAGAADLPGQPNVLRVMLGELSSEQPGEQCSDKVWMVQTNLDDATGQMIGPLYELLLGRGALDVYVTAVQMKKNRPGVLLSVLTEAEKLREIEDTLFEHTPTFGLRRYLCERSKLAREIMQVKTRYGVIRVKIGLRESKVLSATAEFEDCQAAALACKVSCREVQAEALRCYRNSLDK